MATNIVINNVRSVLLGDVYPSDNVQRQSGAGSCIRVLRVQSEEGEIRISLSSDVAENILLSYQKR